MSTMLKRLSILLLAVTFVLGTTAQLTPRAFAFSMAGTNHAAMSAHGSPQKSDMGAPCKGMAPTCIDEMCCAIVAALPTALASVPVPVEWAAVVYPLLASALDGRAVEPELSPPIVSA